MRSINDIIKTSMQFAGEYEILWECPSCTLYQILYCDMSAIIEDVIACEDCKDIYTWDQIHIEHIEVF